MAVVFFDFAPGDELKIGNGTVIALVKKTGQRAKIRVKSEYNMQMVRSENEHGPPHPQQQAPIKRPL